MTIERITVNPLIMGGKPCIKGTRVTVGTLLGLLSSGISHAEILDAYPYIKEEDIRAALEYATWRVEEVELDLKIA
ncbi:MAG: DUF433 domain-containing protein [Opitutaceae bacterium]|jgi:uncharacterized protein (DUF433 family)|nr:DUF433 domain-containing protein [Opitutaceae bacterium]